MIRGLNVSNDKTIRDSGLYVSYQTRKGVIMVARAMDIPVDALGSMILDKWLNEHHPEVIAIIKKQDEEMGEFQTKLKDKVRDDVD